MFATGVMACAHCRSRSIRRRTERGPRTAGARAFSFGWNGEEASPLSRLLTGFGETDLGYLREPTKEARMSVEDEPACMQGEEEGPFAVDWQI